MKPGTVVIKKYGNRGLYDTAASRYVNLDDIAGFVREGKEVQVVDAVQSRFRAQSAGPNRVLKGLDVASWRSAVRGSILAALRAGITAAGMSAGRPAGPAMRRPTHSDTTHKI